MADALIGKVKAMFVGDSTNLVQATKQAEKALQEMGDAATETAQDTQTAARKTEKSLDKIGEQAKETARDTGKALGKSEEAVKDLGDTTEKVAKDSSAAMRRMADTIGTAFATAQLVRFGRESVMAAADVEEALNATRVIFGDSAAEIEAFASTASTALGQSRKSVLDASNTFATFGKSAGLAGQDLNNFTLQMVNLSSDLASFRNTTPEDAIMAIGAALRGEMEPIRRYGVLLNDATLTQEAMAMGLVNTTKGALEPSVKVLAAQAAILKQTTDAQGDFARTSTSLSNQVKIANAQIADMKANIGTALVPAVQGALIPLNLMAGVFNKLDTGTQKFIGQLVFMNASLLLVGRTLKNFGYQGALVSKALIGLNTAMFAAIAVSKIFAAGSQNNTREVQDFTKALQENDTALRNNNIEKMAQEDPQVRQYLNTLGELGITLNDMSRYLKTLDGPAAEARMQIAEIARTGLDAKSKLELLNKEMGTNYDVTGLTAEGAENLWSTIHNLQFVLFNLEQDWRNNTLGTNAFANALGGVTAEGDGVNSVLTQTAENFAKYREAVLGATWATERDFTKALAQAEVEVMKFVGGLEEGKMSSADLVIALIDQADKLLELQYAAGDSTEKLAKITPVMRLIVQAMYRAGEASGKTVPQVKLLIDQLGLLDGIDPTIAIALTMDVSQIKAQIDQLKKGIEVAKRIGNFAMLAGLTKELEALTALGDAITQVGEIEIKPPSGGGGGGGSDDAFGWVENWVQDLTRFVATVFDKDFASGLVDASSEKIADALEQLAIRGAELGITKIEGGGGFVSLVQEASKKLQDMAAQLGGPEGLRAKSEKASAEVDDLTESLKDLRNEAERFDPSVIGGFAANTELERLREAQDELENLRGALENTRTAQKDFALSYAETASKLDIDPRFSVVRQMGSMLSRAREFKDIIVGLRDRGFPVALIREVLSAGTAGGIALGKKLLSLSEGDLKELKTVQQQIQDVTAETGAIAADVLFSADVSDAEKAFDKQAALVKQLFNSAITEAEKNLAKATENANILKTALEDLEATMRSTIAQLGDDIDKLVSAITGGYKPPEGSTPSPTSPPNIAIPPDLTGPDRSIMPIPGLPTARTYTVAKGDSPFGIAAKLLGQGNRWKEIYDLNNLWYKKDGSFQTIFPGQVLRIPALENGGVVSRDVLARVGENGREAVLPLTDPSVMSMVGRAIGEHVRGGDIYVTVNANGHDAEAIKQATLNAIREGLGLTAREMRTR